MEREYIVIVNRGVDLAAFDAEMADSQGHGPIPARSIDIANPRPASNRQTHWMITDEEAEAIRTDPRVLAVEIPPDQRTDIDMDISAIQYPKRYTFHKGYNTVLADGKEANWGLTRTNYRDVPWADGVYTGLPEFTYSRDGTGVDVVIQDGGIDPDHPEWEDANGVSRLQQINWYTASGLAGTQNANHYRDYDGHGTHVASTAAGKIFGWAKNAHIYSLKVAGLEGTGDSGTGISVTDCFDVIKEWHRKKNDPADPSYTGRPTVVNMSWGYGTTVGTAAFVSGIYRGVGWTYSGQTDSVMHSTYGIQPYGPFGGSRRMPAQVASVDTDVEELIDAGVHVCIAAGNDNHGCYYPGDTDYDNEVTFDGFSPRYYHRPSSPYSEKAFNVGNINYYNTDVNGVVQETASYSSKRGTAVNIWAPGEQISAAMSTINKNRSYPPIADYVGGGAHLQQHLSGTSMASPQVAGVVALHLQANPRLTPAAMLTRIINDTTPGLIRDNGNRTWAQQFSVCGSALRTLYNRYNQEFPGTRTRTQVLDIANTITDFFPAINNVVDGWFELETNLFCNRTQFHGEKLIGKSLMCKARFNDFPIFVGHTQRWGIKGSGTTRYNFRMYTLVNFDPPEHSAEINTTDNDITGTGAAVPAADQTFYYGLHFPNATTLEFSFNGTVCHTETLSAGWLTSDGPQRPYFAEEGGNGLMEVQWCATLATATVADAYSIAQGI